MADFFERTDIHRISQQELTEIEGRHETGYLTAVIDRQVARVFTCVEQAGYDVDAIRAKLGTARDTILLDLIDCLVYCKIYMSVSERDLDRHALVMEEMKMVERRLRDIAQGKEHIQTDYPDEPEFPSGEDSKKSGLMGPNFATRNKDFY